MKNSILIVGLIVLVSIATACWAEKEETNNSSANYLKHSIPSETIKYISGICCTLLCNVLMVVGNYIIKVIILHSLILLESKLFTIILLDVIFC